MRERSGTICAKFLINSFAQTKNLKRMKQVILIIAVIVMAVGLNAQDKKERHRNPEMEKRMEELKAEKVAFLTEKMDLLPETAEKFFPLYNEYSKKRMELGRKRGRFFWAYKKIEEKSPEELEKLADAFVDRQVKEADLLEVYHTKFKKILNSKQLFILYISEEEFHKRLLRRIHEFRKGKDKGEQPPKEGAMPPPPPPEE